MSKVKRFSLEERYGYQNRKVIYDKNDNNDIELNNIYPIIDLLNQLDEQILDLQHRLEVAENALNKMSNYAINDNDLYDLVSDFNIENERYDEDHFGIDTYDVIDYFKEHAEKELKGEKL